MKMFKVPEEFRIPKGHPLGSDSTYGNKGAFRIRFNNRSTAMVIASDGRGWEHVSVHIITKGRPRTPTWAEMCRIKRMFWSDEACVVQYHPPKTDYINLHNNTLHMWRPIGVSIPMPPHELV